MSLAELQANFSAANWSTYFISAGLATSAVGSERHFWAEQSGQLRVWAPMQLLWSNLKRFFFHQISINNHKKLWFRCKWVCAALQPVSVQLTLMANPVELEVCLTQHFGDNVVIVGLPLHQSFMRLITFYNKSMKGHNPSFSDLHIFVGGNS
jgi:hypothetical protein